MAPDWQGFVRSPFVLCKKTDKCSCPNAFLTDRCDTGLAMKSAVDKKECIGTLDPPRAFSNSLQSIASQPWVAAATVRVLDLADELQSKPQVLVVGVVDPSGRFRGLVLRDHLFALVGKPFGRDVLQRSTLAEIAEPLPALDGRLDIFAGAEQIRRLREEDRVADFLPLLDGTGRLQGIVSVQDMVNRLARMTEDDIESTGRLQERLLAGSDPASVSSCSIRAWSRAAKGVGGDFYFVRSLSDGRVFASLCDVSGKGVSASFVVAMVWGLLSGYDFRHGLRELLIRLNRAVISSFHMEKYLTGVFLVYDPGTSRMVCADMGHSHVALFRGGRSLSVRGKRLNLPIGIEPEIDPALLSFKLQSGDTLTAYSDGLTEQQNAGGEEFGDARLMGLLRRSLETGAAPETLIPEALDAYRAGTPQQDDMSFLMVSPSEAAGS